MFRNFFSFLLLPAIVGLSPLLGSVALAAPSTPPRVAVSLPLFALIVKDLSGGKIDTWTLAPGSEDVHHLELGPQTLIQLQKIDLLILNGLGMEASLIQWLKIHPLKSPVLMAAEENPPTENNIATSRSTNPANTTNPTTATNSTTTTVDPHRWHSPLALKIYLRNIAKALSTLAPTLKEPINQRLQSIEAELAIWVSEKQTEMKTLSKDGTWLIVTGHGGFHSLAEFWGFETLALSSDHSDEILSPKQLTLRIQKIRVHKNRLFLGEYGEDNGRLKEWADKTQSPWAGELWSDCFENKEKAAPPTTLMEYMKANLSKIMNGAKAAKLH